MMTIDVKKKLRRNSVLLLMIIDLVFMLVASIIFLLEVDFDSKYSILSFLTIVTVNLISFLMIYRFNKNQMLSIADLILNSSEQLNFYAVDLNFRYLAFNKSDVMTMEKYFDFTPVEGDYFGKYLLPSECEACEVNFLEAFKGRTFTVLDIIEKKNEILYWQCMYSPLYNAKNQVIGASCIVLDVTDQYLKQIEKDELIYKDALTHNFNRRYFEEAFQAVLELKPSILSVIITDLNEFKAINDTYGHKVGDDLLIWFGRKLIETMPESAIVSRLGGDEFAILLADFTPDQVQLAIDKVRLAINDYHFDITASFGVVTEPVESGWTFNDYYQRADEMMYRDKQRFVKSSGN